MVGYLAFYAYRDTMIDAGLATIAIESIYVHTDVDAVVDCDLFVVVMSCYCYIYGTDADNSAYCILLYMITQAVYLLTVVFALCHLSLLSNMDRQEYRYMRMDYTQPSKACMDEHPCKDESVYLVFTEGTVTYLYTYV